MDWRLSSGTRARGGRRQSSQFPTYPAYVEAQPVVAPSPTYLAQGPQAAAATGRSKLKQVSFRLPGSTDLMSDSGRAFHVLRKQDDGSWLIIRDFFHSDVPLESG